jgi:hypothetical protein
MSARTSSTLVLTFLALATSVPAAAQAPELLPVREVERILAIDGAARHEESCTILRSGLVSEIFSVDDSQLTSNPLGITRVPSAYCSVTWDKPDKEALEAACSQMMMDHTQRRVRAMTQREEFNEPIPTCPRVNLSVSLGIASVHDSTADAVAALESLVGTLTEGVEIEVQGEQRTARVNYDTWIDDVGDRAVWGSRYGELQIASGRIRFVVTVSGFDDPAENLEWATRLAQRIIGGGRERRPV